MRPILVQRHGGPKVLVAEDVPVPVPGPGEALVELAAARVNFRDVYERSGGVYPTAPPCVLGGEGCGRGATVAAGVTGLDPRDRVVWVSDRGSYPDQVVVPAERFVPVPHGGEDEVAAAVLLQGMTAHSLSASTYQVAAGDVALVHAATGGAGLLRTQMIRQRAGDVIATVACDEKEQLARAAGAEHVLRCERFPATVRDLTGGQVAAVMYDGVGDATFDGSLQSLRPSGMLVLYGASSEQVPPVEPQRLNTDGALYVTRPRLGHYTADRGELLQRASDVLGAVASGGLRVRIGGRYPLADASAAHRDLEARRTTGKLLLLPG